MDKSSFDLLKNDPPSIYWQRNTIALAERLLGLDKGVKVEQDLAQQAYHTWLTSLYGSTDAAFIKGVKTWENLPEKAQQAWYDTVEYVKSTTMKGIPYGK